MEIKFLKQIEIQMGAETQFSVLMGVNHIKLFIRYFFLQSHTAVLYCRIRIRIEKAVGSGSAKNECGTTATALVQIFWLRYTCHVPFIRYFLNSFALCHYRDTISH